MWLGGWIFRIENGELACDRLNICFVLICCCVIREEPIVRNFRHWREQIPIQRRDEQFWDFSTNKTTFHFKFEILPASFVQMCYCTLKIVVFVLSPL